MSLENGHGMPVKNGEAPDCIAAVPFVDVEVPTGCGPVAAIGDSRMGEDLSPAMCSTMFRILSRVRPDWSEADLKFTVFTNGITNSNNTFLPFCRPFQFITCQI